MRFDNPITNHGFELPDVADYVDVRQEQRLIDTDCTSHINDLRLSFQRGDFAMFQKGLDILIKHTQKEMPLDENEMTYIAKWKKRTVQLFNDFRWFEDKLKNKKHNAEKIADSHWHQDLYENGFAPGTYPNVAPIRKMLASEIKKLLESPDSVPKIGSYDRAVPKLDKNYPEVINELNKQFEELGILDAVKKYLKLVGNPLVTKATLHVSKPTDKHLFQMFQDCKTAPVTTNLHIDPKEGLVKALLYLDSVEDHNGPIWFVKRSHRWKQPDLETLLARGISTGCYFENPTARRSVFRLPKELRKSFQFGTCLEDGSAQQKLLLDNAVRITNEYGNIVLFDAGNVMHTGGWVKEGHRINLQIQIRI